MTSTLRAAAGDWLVVESSLDTRHRRQAQILGTGAGGAPPFRVRWTDTDQLGLLFPGPDARVVSAAEQHDEDRADQHRVEALQAELRSAT